MKHKVIPLFPLVFVMAACSFSVTKTAKGGTRTHTINTNITPRFECFDEVAYLAYAIDHLSEEPAEETSEEPSEVPVTLEDSLSSSNEEMEQSSTTGSTSIKPKLSQESSSQSEEEEDPYAPYYDESDRLHYPIEIKSKYTFSDFTYFALLTDECPFLEERIGCGDIEGLIVKTDIFDEMMIVLKNEDRYFSCFTNGYSADFHQFTYDFSCHKYLEGFDLVKDDNKKHIEVTFEEEPEKRGWDRGDFSEFNLTKIDFDGVSFQIERENTSRDAEEKEISVNELRKFFGLEPDPRFE